MAKVNFIGRVIDHKSTPISGAKVTLDFEGTPPVVYTDGQGIYRFPVNFDGNNKVSGCIWVSASDYKTEKLYVDLYPTSELQEFRLNKESDEKVEENKNSIKVAVIGAAAVIIAALIAAGFPILQRLFTPEVKEKKGLEGNLSPVAMLSPLPPASNNQIDILPTFAPEAPNPSKLVKNTPSLKPEIIPIPTPSPTIPTQIIPTLSQTTPAPVAQNPSNKDRKRRREVHKQRLHTISFSSSDNPRALSSDFTWNSGASSDSNYELLSSELLKMKTGGNTDLYELRNSAPTLNYGVSGDFEAQVKVKFSSKISYQRAGIGIRPVDNPSYFTRIHLLENNRIEMAQNRFGYGEEKVSTQDFIQTYPSDTVYLRVRKKGNTVRAYYSPDKSDWALAGSYKKLKIPNQAQIFLYVLSAHNPNSASAEFSDFKLKRLQNL